MPSGKGKGGGRGGRSGGYASKGRVKTGPPRDRRLGSSRAGIKKSK